ncbi:MAG: hypothetical protein LBI76_01310, partial [Comamonas sp.]|nr:hypothetical protein [Comamonas sp.]
MTTEPQDGMAQDGLPSQRSTARTLTVPDGATASLLHTVERWTAHGWLRSLDQALVLFLHELDPAASPLVLLAAALASHQLGRGHVCLDLQATLDNSRFALSLPPDTV